jgi:hypothetical protein
MKLILNFAFFLLLITNVNGQSKSAVRQSIPSPVSEQFSPAFGYICEAIGFKNRYVQDRKDSDTIKIYNSDGSMWYEYAISEENPLHYTKNPKADFHPIGLPSIVPWMKLVRESINWFEVVVNEDDGTTKFIRKNDPVLGKQGWEKTIRIRNSIGIDTNSSPLRDRPEGKIREIKYLEEDYDFTIEDIVGDWLYVFRWREDNETSVQGWIRWRSGNELFTTLPSYIKDKRERTKDAVDPK